VAGARAVVGAGGLGYHFGMLPTIEWQPDAVVMVDQRKLPGQELYVRCRTANEVARAI
jgi:methylthioribose-1-phosphate isomerase